MSFARVTSSAMASFLGVGGYLNAIEKLNGSEPRRGFIWQQYSPASSAYCGVKRMYFTEQNAQKIDGIRRNIAEWVDRGLLTGVEEKMLLADLIGAANRVANTAGTYGCFLSK